MYGQVSLTIKWFKMLAITYMVNVQSIEEHMIGGHRYQKHLARYFKSSPSPVPQFKYDEAIQERNWDKQVVIQNWGLNAAAWIATCTLPHSPSQPPVTYHPRTTTKITTILWHELLLSPRPTWKETAKNIYQLPSGWETHQTNTCMKNYQIDLMFRSTHPRKQSNEKWINHAPSVISRH